MLSIVSVYLYFVLMCVSKMRTVTRKERERRNIIDEMELHEIYEHYKDFDDYI